jgi:peroxisomal membrane protein 2
MNTPAMMTSPTKRHPLLAAYLTALALHPLRTRALTLGTTAFLQEVLSSHLAHTPAQLPGKRASPLLHALARAKVDLKVRRSGWADTPATVLSMRARRR